MVGIPVYHAKPRIECIGLIFTGRRITTRGRNIIENRGGFETGDVSGCAMLVHELDYGSELLLEPLGSPACIPQLLSVGVDIVNRIAGAEGVRGQAAVLLNERRAWAESVLKVQEVGIIDYDTICRVTADTQSIPPAEQAVPDALIHSFRKLPAVTFGIPMVAPVIIEIYRVSPYVPIPEYIQQIDIKGCVPDWCAVEL